MTKPKFEPGEWAVLQHDQGARLFQVGGQNAQHGHRYLEAQSEWAIKHKQPADSLGSPESSLVKVKDKDTGLRLVGALSQVAAAHRSRVADLERQRDGDFRRAVGEYEFYQPEGDEE